MHSGDKLAIVVPCSWDYVPIQFFQSFIQFDIPWQWSVVMPTRGRVDDLRNNAIAKIIENGSFNKILFLDTDHIFPPDTIKKLLSHNKDIVSGISFRRSEPYDPILFNFKENSMEQITKWVDGELIEVGAVGAACLLVDISVLKNISKNKWFEMNYKFGDGVISEDLAFCLKAKNAGYKVYVDTSCTNDHLGILHINKSVWEKHNNI